MFDPHHLIDLPPVSVKLLFTLNGGHPFEGTGFCVEHAGRTWLITCRHNVEDREYDFVGSNDLSSMNLIGEGEIDVSDDTRSVVAIRVDGFIPDCAAIELRPGEWENHPKFSTAITMTVEGSAQPETINFLAPPPSAASVQVKPTGWLYFQGFPGGLDRAVTLRGVRLVPLPTIIQSWMPTYLPAPVKGFSGGPVLDMTNRSSGLLGITTHAFPADFHTPMPDGAVATIGLRAAACVPTAPLFWATERATSGACVVDVRSPLIPVL